LFEIVEVPLLDESPPTADIAEYPLEFGLLREKQRRVVEEWNAAHDRLR
jgi:hypothetical protein